MTFRKDECNAVLRKLAASPLEGSICIFSMRTLSHLSYRITCCSGHLRCCAALSGCREAKIYIGKTSDVAIFGMMPIGARANWIKKTRFTRRFSKIGRLTQTDSCSGGITVIRQTRSKTIACVHSPCWLAAPTPLPKTPPRIRRRPDGGSELADDSPAR